MVGRFFTFIAFAWLLLTGSVFLSGHPGPDPSAGAQNIAIGFVAFLLIGCGLSWVIGSGRQSPRKRP